MPREVSLNDPLSGAEIKAICVQKFSDALDRDTTLVGDITYPGFSLSFSAHLKYLRSTTAGTMVWADTTTGEAPAGDSVATDVVQGEYATDSPNTAREENDLPLPVMVQTPSGPKRQKVKFAKPHVKAKN